MSGSGWIRVAAGLQKVAEAAVQQTAGEVGTAAARAAQHGVGLAALARAAAAAAAAAQSSSSPWEPSHNYPLHQSSQSHHDGVSQSTQKDISNEHFVARTAAAVAAQSSSSWEPFHYHPSSQNQHHDGVAQSTQQDMSPHEDRAPSTSQTGEVESSTENFVAAENQIGVSPPPSPATTAARETSTIQHLPEGIAVPASRIGRAMGFASLGAGLVWGTASEGLSRLLGSSSGSTTGSVVVNDANADRVAASIRRMRGAALKMGQMLSIQDESLLPPALSRALYQVRQGAQAMPHYQLEQQLVSQLGMDWHDKFIQFDELPFAAASIGQVHRATICISENGPDRHAQTGTSRSGSSSSFGQKDVVVKVQYPGVARSIESDLNNLSMLVKWTGLAPKGLFLENIIRVGKEELKVECDYRREMLNQQRIQELVHADPFLRDNRFVVPHVVERLTTDQVITSSYRPGGTIEKVSGLDQEERNRIGRAIMYLTMKELFVWRFMQTDPNWGNFLYDMGSRTTSLIDFGAAREYSKDFVDGYLRIVWASAQRDEKTLMEQSRRMKFLTGSENEEMLRAHKLSGFTVGEPFWTNEPFDFRGSNISTRMGEHTAVFLRHRLTPPPEEIYTLHRKLAGAYLLCIKLGAVVQCRDMLEGIVANHDFEDGLGSPLDGNPI